MNEAAQDAMADYHALTKDQRLTLTIENLRRFNADERALVLKASRQPEAKASSMVNSYVRAYRNYLLGCMRGD